MMSDPNPGRTVPLGGRTFPPDAAGTMLANGLVVSGDDADKWRRAGYPVMQMCVQCSARIARGEDSVQPGIGTVQVAVERHGASLESIERMMGSDGLRHATGVYKGATSAVAFGWLHAADIVAAHEALTAGLPGFECFAVFT